MKTRIIIPALLACCGLALSGCAGTRLYDKSKANVATAIKTKYAEADILGTIEAQKKNLEALLAEELKVIRENHRLQADFALLELADNDTPMADTWRDEIELPLLRLGIASDLGGLRTFLTDLKLSAVWSDKMATFRNQIKKRGVKDLPPCLMDTDPPEPDDWKLPEGLDARATKIVKNFYGQYKKACEEKKKSIMSKKFRGQLGAAKQAWDNAKSGLEEWDLKVKDTKTQVDDAAKAHKAAFADAKKAKKKGKEFREKIKEKAKELRDALKKADEVAPEVVSEQRLSAIVTLLQVAAGGETKVEDDPDLAKSVELVKGLSSLSGDIAQLVASAKAPSVRNLLIELQHQTVLLEHAKALRALRERRIAMRKAKFEAYLKEARLILKFRDALCSFAYYEDTSDKTRGIPGTKCDSFEPPAKGATGAEASTCKIKIKIKIKKFTPCVLSQPWRKFLKTPPQNDAGREFYKALAAYTQLFPVRASQIEKDFNLIDLQHQENLANREMALWGWHNLASVPIEQLDAYFQSGLKPEAIADVIVKALGFTAITVGVSQ